MCCCCVAHLLFSSQWCGVEEQSILLSACVSVTLFEVAIICVGTFDESNCEIVNHME